MIEINQGEGGKNIDIACKDPNGDPVTISGFTAVQMVLMSPKGKMMTKTAVVGVGSGVIDGVTYPAGTWARYVSLNNELQELGTWTAQLKWLDSTNQSCTLGFVDIFELVRSGWGGC